MELHQLKCFLAVAECGSVTRAAERLFMTQSAVSRVIARLEEELGTPLFDRGGRGLTLNGSGELFEFYCSSAMRYLDMGVQAVGLGAERPQRVSIRSELLRGLLERAIRQCTVYFQQVEFTVTGLADAAPAALPDLLLTAEERPPWQAVAAYDERWCFLLGRSAPERLAPETPLEEIARLPLILWGTDADGDFVRGFFERAGLRPNLLSTRDPRTSSAMVERGLAVGCIPLRFYLDSWKDAQADAPFTPVFCAPEPFSRRIFLCRREGFGETPLERQIATYLDERLRGVEEEVGQFHI